MKILLIPTLIIASFCCQGQNTFKITKELTTLSVSYNQLSDIINNTLHLIKRYDTLFNESEYYITISKDNEVQSFRDVQTINEIYFDKVFAFRFELSNYHGTIKSVTIDLSDYHRKIDVEGNNYIEVQTLANQIESQLLNHKAIFSGRLFRFMCGLLLFAIGLIVLNHPIFSKPNNRTVLFEVIRLSVGALILIFAMTASYSDIFSFDKIFSGFIALKSDASFLSRNSDSITIIGLLLGVISLPFFGNLRFFKKKETG